MQDNENEELTTMEKETTDDTLTVMQRVARLIDVKSIMTVSLTIGFVIMSCSNTVPDSYLEIYKMIIIFYFGYQSAKKTSE